VASRLRITVAALTLGCLTVLAAGAWAARFSPSLPSGIPAPERGRLAAVTDQAVVATHVEGDPFPARRAVVEFLLDHPVLATQASLALKAARYRIWRTAEGLHVDDGWGASGQFRVAHAADQTRVFHARGRFRQRLLPTIRGEAVVVVTYDVRPGDGGPPEVTPAVTGYVRLESQLLAATARLMNRVVERKAEREARKIAGLFARVSQAIEEDPAGLYERLRERPDVAPAELEALGRLVGLR
jgi:hypothetical protein